MILIRDDIILNIKKGKIIYSEKNFKNIGPNSIDVTLNKKIKTYLKCKIDKYNFDNKVFNVLKPLETNIILDMKKENKVYEYEIPENGIIINPGMLILGTTNEIVGSRYFVPMYEGRSSLARIGLLSHLSAGFGDIGFIGKWTLEITTIHPIIIYPNIRIGQIYFYNPSQIPKEDTLYNGKYQNQNDVMESKLFKDFF